MDFPVILVETYNIEICTELAHVLTKRTNKNGDIHHIAAYNIIFMARIV